MKKRNTTIDVLRIIGILSVIAAHCEISQPYYALREFDVVMLMTVSGMSYAIGHREKGMESYLSYVRKRFKRLLFPVYLFLVVFFLVFQGILHYSFGLTTILKSFALLAGGIMYIWVYRVFFTTSLLNPWMQRLVQKTGPLASFMLSAVFLLGNTLVYGVVIGNAWSKIFEYIVTYTVGYGAMALCGIAYVYGNQKDRWIAILIYLIVFLFGLHMYGFEALQVYKHPPMLYYVSYGMVVTLIGAQILDWVHVPEFDVVSKLSDHAMTIYLWHIVFYYLLIGGNVRRVALQGLPLFLVIVLLSVICTFIQDFLKRRISK